MRLKKYLFLSVIIAAFGISCSSDDDNGDELVERDRAEQEATDQEALLTFLETHFYNYEDFQNPPADFDYVVRFDTINEANADKQPLIESDLLESKTVTRNDIEHTLYILKVREGAGRKPTIADSAFVGYKGQLINQTIFDQEIQPVWFDLPGYLALGPQGRPQKVGGLVEGFPPALAEFGAASGFTVNPDNTVEWNNDYGIGAVFMPSGLAYFSAPRGGIPAYSPLIFSFHLYQMNEADHDRDGIPSYMEDLNENRYLYDDDTDGDGLTNHSDADDDGDMIPTREEIVIEEDGTITFPDTNGNGVLDYLDPSV